MSDLGQDRPADPLGTIEQCMVLASEGSPEAVRAFYSKLVAITLHVPERHQPQRLRETVTYPNEFLNLFAVQTSEEVTIPAFTRSEFAEAWADGPLKCRTLTVQELFSLLPDEWTVTINPGQEVEKEISWWEVQRLRHGAEGIEEVVAEILQDAPVQSLNVEQAGEKEFKPTIDALKETAAGESRVRKVYLLKETALGADNREVVSLLIGAEIERSAAGQDDQLEATLKAAAAKTQIGGYPVKIFWGDSPESVALGPFRQFEAIFVREDKPSGLWSRLRRAFSF